MPVEAKPLFRPDVVRAKLAGFALPTALASSRPKDEGNRAARRLHPRCVRRPARLGRPASGAPVYTLKRESLVQVDGKFADAALGRFTMADGQADFVVIIEGKGPRDPLDRALRIIRLPAIKQTVRLATSSPGWRSQRGFCLWIERNWKLS